MADKSKIENEYKKPRMFVDEGPIVITKQESKSWDEHEAACRIVKAKAQEIQKKMESLVKDWAEFEGATITAYKKMPTTDAMFSDSPISPKRMEDAFRKNLAKLGWKWAAGLTWGPDGVRPFQEIVSDACVWGERILKDKARKEKIEAANKLAQKAQEDIKSII